MLYSRISISALGLFLIAVLLVTITAYLYWKDFINTMLRILILIVLAWILYQIIKRVIANLNAQSSSQKQEVRPDEKMLQCAECGCHVIESDTKVINKKIICNNPECSKVANGN
jgi:sensor histidine kinase regulating citrate/malate metabolism